MFISYFFIIIFQICFISNVSNSQKVEYKCSDCEHESMSTGINCSDKNVIAYINNILPNKDSEFLLHEKEDIKSIDELSEIFFRLNVYKENISEITDPLENVLIDNVKKYLLSSSTKTECLKSLIGILNGLKNQEKWALKCEFS